MQLVHEAAALSVAQARLRLSVEIELVDLAVAVAAEQVLGRARRRTHAPRRPHPLDDAHGLHLGIEHLNPPVPAIGDVQLYDSLYMQGGWTRRRLLLKVADDPFNKSTTRQMLIALGLLTALVVWRSAARKV